MTVWSWVILMVTFGLVSTFEVLLIMSMVGKVIESKMQLQSKLYCNEYEKILDRFDKGVEKFANQVKELIVEYKKPVVKSDY